MMIVMLFLSLSWFLFSLNFVLAPWFLLSEFLFFVSCSSYFHQPAYFKSRYSYTLTFLAS